ncbi:MAG: hypothetical protein QGH60_05600 [Phycisphaerae bacterium]|jgi:hypothetical protein|nr:hypothetical protein [Phycisphaerae bacterium]
MKRISYIIGIVLLCSLAVEKASALTPKERRLITNEYTALTAQRQRTLKDLNNVYRVVNNSQEMFVYSLNGSNRWEFWTTKQVAARLQQISRNQAAYRAWWQHMAEQHQIHCQYVIKHLMPNLRTKLDALDSRLKQLSRMLAAGKRAVLTPVVVGRSPVYINIRDSHKQDGDIVAVYIDGVLKQTVKLTNRGTTLMLPLAFGHHRLEVVALNTGDEGLNTASVKISGVVKGKRDQKWQLRKNERTTMWINVLPRF